ncbi:hypothetical protein F5888DRAFT_1714123 [Russula emetica]|nr:hypothetical protein F5888DRAFT_1714123 [Russula emetica]
MQVKCERETHTMQVSSGMPWETVTLTTLSHNRALFSLLLAAEARDSALHGQEGHHVMHIMSLTWGTEWCPFGLPRCKRPLCSIVLTPGIMVNR